jgi:hypothetical protein
VLREAKGIRIEVKKKFLGPQVYRVWKTKTIYWEFECANHAQDAKLQLSAPVLIGQTVEKGNLWWFGNRYYWDGDGDLSQADVVALLVQRARRKQATLEKAHATLAAPVQVVEPSPASRREPIPESVRHEVWRRDEGRCVDCGSRERLEFDHIIPVSRGGSNTARNLELRCESCNRSKGATI